MPTVTEPGGLVVNADNGLPAYSSLTAPGSAAHVASVPLTLSGSTLTLAPPASVLTGPGVTYPVYIDPTWHNFASAEASAWTQVDSGFPSQSYWHESSDLQSGNCYDSPPGSCKTMGVARSFIRMPIPSALYSTTDIHSAYMYMTEDWAPSCTKTSVRLYNVNGISSATTWNNQPSWPSTYIYQDAAFGYTGCGYYKNDITWDVTSTIASDAGYKTTQAFGLRAADETDTGQWKQFWSGAENITLSVTYNYHPNAPSNLTTSPGGSCHTSSSSPAQIGNDDVTFSAYASDNDSDNNLSTRFAIYNPSGGTPVYDSASSGSNVVTGNKTDARLALSRTQFHGFHTDGSTAAYTYYWQAQTGDDFGLTSSWSGKCWFTYNPQGPSAPTVGGPSSAALGSSATFTFTAPAGCSPTTSPCPISYTYQLGVSTPVTVTPNTSGDDWQGNITINRVGPLTLSVYGTSAGGNPGEVYPFSFAGTPPSAPYPDGYFTNGSYPDVITVGTGAKPSLWLSTGSGNGTLYPPVDIGSLGIGINPGTDGPGDWAGAMVLHGDFTGDLVQDVMAYYPSGPHQGTGVIIGGTGDAATVVPAAGNTWTIPAYQMADPNLCNSTCDYPTDLVSAGNASQIGTGTDDLIGISGDSTNGYELGLYTSGTCSGCGFPLSYGFDTALSATAPGGDSWNNYTLATAQPGCYPGNMTSCNKSNVVLFALDTATGALYESTNSNGPVGTNGTWTSALSVPWGSKPPAAPPATSTARPDRAVGAIRRHQYRLYPHRHDPQRDELPALQRPARRMAPHRRQRLRPDQHRHHRLRHHHRRHGQPQRRRGLELRRLLQHRHPQRPERLHHPGRQHHPLQQPPQDLDLVQDDHPDQVLVSLRASPSPAGRIPRAAMTVPYIGTDGKLYGERGTQRSGSRRHPLHQRFDDGLWNDVVLTGYANRRASTSTTAAINYPGSIKTLPTPTTDLTIGAAEHGGTWPRESMLPAKNGNTATLEYFNGADSRTPSDSYPGGP